MWLELHTSLGLHTRSLEQHRTQGLHTRSLEQHRTQGQHTSLAKENIPASRLNTPLGVRREQGQW